MRMTPAGLLLLNSIPRTAEMAFTVGTFGGDILAAKRKMRNCIFFTLRREFCQRARNAEPAMTTYKCVRSAAQGGCKYLPLGSTLPRHQKGQRSQGPGVARSLRRHASCGS